MGPVYDSSEKGACERDLRGCYRESLELVGRAAAAAAADGRREDGRTIEVEEDGGEGKGGEGASIAFFVYFDGGVWVSEHGGGACGLWDGEGVVGS